MYRVEYEGKELVLSGNALMQGGIPVPREVPDFTSFIYHIRAVN